MSRDSQSDVMWIMFPFWRELFLILLVHKRLQFFPHKRVRDCHVTNCSTTTSLQIWFLKSFVKHRKLTTLKFFSIQVFLQSYLHEVNSHKKHCNFWRELPSYPPRWLPKNVIMYTDILLLLEYIIFFISEGYETKQIKFFIFFDIGRKSQLRTVFESDRLTR